MNDKLTLIEFFKYNKSTYQVWHDTYITHRISLPTKLLKSVIDKMLREELNKTKQNLDGFESCFLSYYYTDSIKYILMNYISRSEWDRLFKQVYKDKINSMTYDELEAFVAKHANPVIYHYKKDFLLKLPIHELKHQLTSRTFMFDNVYLPNVESFHNSKVDFIDSYIGTKPNSEDDYDEWYQNVNSLLHTILVKYQINIYYRGIAEYLLREYDINYILNTLGYRISKRKSNKKDTYLISINRGEIPLYEQRKEK